ncbi:hypothetical protein PAXRUDRAFT_835632 [Paxillus rubicundulus Ve08.2h10]|uniref:Uncharacterized protein n=1 Tax=Paxillus rubicundulus Ve08.2h10 TaxID=930991 RepID=A0A0D0DDM7_9AGAM|nr:hypothetical protein PAXRUDRAFT_835632 [Paxillus rubicundulus Ve08.2h10]
MRALFAPALWMVRHCTTGAIKIVSVFAGTEQIRRSAFANSAWRESSLSVGITHARAKFRRARAIAVIRATRSSSYHQAYHRVNSRFLLRLYALVQRQN